MSDYTPTTAEVAAHVRARLKEPGGFEPEDFTANTRPTLTQVQTLVVQGNRAVASRIGPTLCADATDLEADGKALAAIYVAMLIEQSYYPEQTNTRGSSFDSLYKLWKDGIASLEEAVEERCGTGEGGGEGQSPVSFFDSTELMGRNFPAW